MRLRLRPLEEPYHSRAVPPGSVRYYSWLFASREARDPLLAMYALMAEWRALTDPATEASVAHIKLEWWRAEIMRLANQAPAHPITRYIAAMPRAVDADLASLETTVVAASAQVAGAPLERSSDLAAHSWSMYGIPLLIANKLAGPENDGAFASGTQASGCIADLATADYLTRAVADYRRDARAGRVPFAVDELLNAGIEDADLSAAEPPPPLLQYLTQLQAHNQQHLRRAAEALQGLPGHVRSQQRHLSILVSLGIKHGKEHRSPSSADFRLSDLYNAWNAARHAARGR